MAEKIFCTNCGQIHKYISQKETIVFEGEGYTFSLQVEKPHCKKCGAPVTVESIEEVICKRAHQMIVEQRKVCPI